MAMQGMVSKQDGLHNSFKVQESSPGRRHLRKIAENVTKIKEDIALADTSNSFSATGNETTNARDWGLFHEESACRVHQHVSNHTHHKLELVSKGFLISKSVFLWY